MPISTAWQVREFGVEDAVPYTVEFSWDKDGQLHKQPLFEAGSPFPTTKMLTFMRSEPFKVRHSHIQPHILRVTGLGCGWFVLLCTATVCTTLVFRTLDMPVLTLTPFTRDPHIHTPGDCKRARSRHDDWRVPDWAV